MAPKLEHCFTIRVYISKDATVNIGAVKAGPSRVVVPVTHGFVEGSGLTATVLPGGADWILVCLSAMMLVRCPFF